ncbi:alpha-glucosidase family protein [Polycladidibacter stylochi]|uniref:alpha-glucosidase family protein n=1 Tax=Polycladidibacter stylochi TaxID=1807766 RepID=UPI0008340EEA|nr:alpha-glucosidase family protein [Pseudovibrio stylochi]
MTVAAKIDAPEMETRLVNDPDWWRGAVLYQIYPRSFADSNGDGVGDLPGIIERLPYIANLGADAIWISPFMKSPMDDFGYDVSDYRDVDPMFGTLDDFKQLLQEAHKQGLRVLIDLVISHTSEQHEWFVESRRDRTNDKADWYVWANAKADGSPPNNWLSIFGGSAWQWDTRRLQYYLHNFLRSQPDLNFHNEEVQAAVLDAARFWLELGVDGFRLDTVNFYFHDQELRDNGPNEDLSQLNTAPLSNPYSYQYHTYDKSRPENLAFLEKLRAVMDEYDNRMLVGEIGSEEDPYGLLKEYTEGDKRLHMSYVFDLLSNEPTPDYITQGVRNLYEQAPGGWPCWAMSNHDVKRVVSRLSPEADKRAAASCLLALTSSLKGSPCLYQGEELGWSESEVPYELLQDPYGIEMWPDFKGRDGCRTPMAWRYTEHGGFTSGTPWLPVDEQHIAENVEKQQQDPHSPLQKSIAFLNWRKEIKALQKGAFELIETGHDKVFGFKRELDSETVVCLFNLSNDLAEVHLELLDGCEVLSDNGFSCSLNGSTAQLPAWQAGYFRLNK